jgi:hypothetical protein
MLLFVDPLIGGDQLDTVTVSQEAHPARELSEKK